MKWTKKEYAYPQFHSRKPEHRLKRGDLVEIEVGAVSLGSMQKGKFDPVGKWKYLGLGVFVGCASRKHQMPIFRLLSGRLIGGCECWWVRRDVGQQITAEVMLPKAAKETAHAVRAMCLVLGVQPLHVRPSGDFEALVEWKKKLHHDDVLYSLFVAPNLGKVSRKLARMIAKELKVPLCQKGSCKHNRGCEPLPTVMMSPPTP